MADVSVQNERINGWILSSATNVIMNWPEKIKTQPHDDTVNCFLPFDSKGPCGMTVNNDNDDDSATRRGDSHTIRACGQATQYSTLSLQPTRTCTATTTATLKHHSLRVLRE